MMSRQPAMDNSKSDVNLMSGIYHQTKLTTIFTPTRSIISSGYVSHTHSVCVESPLDDEALHLQLPFSPEPVCQVKKSISKVLTWETYSLTSDHEQIQDDFSSEEEETMMGVDPDDISGSFDKNIHSDTISSPECQSLLNELANILPQSFCCRGENNTASIVSATVDYIKFLQTVHCMKQDPSPISSPDWSSPGDKAGTTTPSGSVHRAEKVKKIGREAGEPRRPKNGFIRFSVEHRKTISKDHPKLDNREISRMLGARWRKMNPEERKPYETEFQTDMRCIKEKFPDWKYAPVKSGMEELIEPIPTRLRDRRYLKRKIPPLSELFAKNTNRSCQRRVSNTDGHLWIKCFVCKKWRTLSLVVDQGSIPDQWYCAMNPDFRYNSCDVPEELNLVNFPDEDDTELYCFCLTDR